MTKDKSTKHTHTDTGEVYQSATREGVELKPIKTVSRKCPCPHCPTQSHDYVVDESEATK